MNSHNSKTWNITRYFRNTLMAVFSTLGQKWTLNSGVEESCHSWDSQNPTGIQVTSLKHGVPQKTLKASRRHTWQPHSLCWCPSPLSPSLLSKLQNLMETTVAFLTAEVDLPQCEGTLDFTLFSLHEQYQRKELDLSDSVKGKLKTKLVYLNLFCYHSKVMMLPCSSQILL